MNNADTVVQNKIRTTLYLARENNNKFLDMVSQIEPVKAELSTEDMLKLLREGKGEQLASHNEGR